MIMTTFHLSAQVTISIYTEVEAETFEEAEQIANERSIESSQFNCKEQQKEAWISDEYDGSPTDIRIEG